MSSRISGTPGYRPLPAVPAVYGRSSDGTPIFKQGDPAWGLDRLGRRETIGSAGCAMCATAMAISRISGRDITPKELDAHLDRTRGYSGDALDWHKAAAARGLSTQRQSLTLSALDAQLDAGRPAVVGVDYKAGSGGGANGTDHWVTVTRKETGASGQPTYWANDPGTGKEIQLTVDARGRLVGDGTDALGRYRTTGQLQVFVP